MNGFTIIVGLVIVGLIVGLIVDFILFDRRNDEMSNELADMVTASNKNKAEAVTRFNQGIATVNETRARLGYEYLDSHKHNDDKKRCVYCGSMSKDDSNGNCRNCGAPRS